MKRMNKKTINSRVLPVLLVLGFVFTGSEAWIHKAVAGTEENGTEESPKRGSEDGKATFVLVEDSGFNALMVAKGTDFSKFKKVKLFPADRSGLEISSKGDPDSVRSWRGAPDEELGVFSDSMNVMMEEVFGDRETFTLVDEATGNVLALQVRLEEFIPMMVAADDVQRRTIGSSQTRGNLGYMSVNAVLVDAEGRKMIGVIQDVILLDSQHVKRNTRSNQETVIRRSFREWLEKLHESLESLQKAERLPSWKQ